MGTFDINGPRSGKTYGFNIQGDTPTDYEYAWISNFIQQQEDEYAKFFEEQLGQPLPEADDGTAVGRQFRKATQDLKGGVGELLESVGQLSGLEYLANIGSDIEESARERKGELSILEPSANLSYRDVLDDPSLSNIGTYAGELTGGSVPYVVGAGAGAVAGAFAGAPLLGASLASGTLFSGLNLQQREEVVGEDNITGRDLATAVGTAAFQASLDTVGLKVLSKLVGGGQLSQLLGPDKGRGLIARILTGGATGLGVEGSTETLQELAGMWQAGYDLDTPEVEEALTEAFVAGGLLGFGIGGVGRGAFGKRKEPKIDDKAGAGADVEIKGDPADTITGTLSTDEEVEAKADEIAEKEAAQDDTPTTIEPDPNEKPLPVDADRAAKIEESKAARELNKKLLALGYTQNQINAMSVEEAQAAALEVKDVLADPSVKAAPVVEPEDTAQKKAKTDELVTKAIANDPQLQGAIDVDFIREELKAKYEPDVLDAIILRKQQTKEVADAVDKRQKAAEFIAKKRAEDSLEDQAPKFKSTRADTIEEGSDGLEVKQSTPVVVSKEILDSLGVTAQAPIRKRIEGKSLYDTTVQQQLKSYGTNTIIKNKVPDFQSKLDELLNSLPKQEATNAVTGVDSEGVGAGVSSGELGVVGGRGQDSGAGDTDTSAASDARPVGTDLLDTDGVDDTAGVQPDTLKVAPEPKEIDQATAVRVQQWLRSTNPFTGSPRTLSELQEGPEVKLAREYHKRATAVYDQNYSIGPTESGLPHRRTPSARWNGMDFEEARKEAEASGDPEMLQAFNEVNRTAIELSAVQDISSRPAEDARRNLKDMFPEYAQQIDDDVYAFVKQATDVDIDRIEPTFTPEQTAPATDAMVRNALGGEETGTAGQVIPKGVESAPRLEAEPTLDELGIDVSEEAANQRLLDLEEQVKKRNIQADIPVRKPLEETYAAWWIENNEKSLKSYVLDVYNAPVTDPALKLPVVFAEDVRKVLELLDTTRFTKGTGTMGKPAKLYFSKVPRVIDALDLIAYDAAGVMVHQSGKNKGQPVTTYRKTKNVGDNENAFFAGTGYNNGTLAYDWVQDNLSPTAKQWLEMRTAMYKRFSDRIKNRQASDFDSAASKAADMEYMKSYFLGRDALVNYDVPMHPAVARALDSGRLDLALQTLAATDMQAAASASDNFLQFADKPMFRTAQLAAKLSTLVGSTKVEVVDSLSNPDAVGEFSPETNTIKLVRDGGLNQHTILHEMIHAVVSHTLDSKNPIPEVAQLNKLFLQIKDDIGEFYGSKDLQEFIAEAMANPQFQAHLALTKVDNGTVSAYQKLLRIIGNIARKVMGLQPKPLNSALDEVDTIVRALMSPAPATRAAPTMYMEMNDPASVEGTLRASMDMIPQGDQKKLTNLVRQSASRTLPEGMRRFILNSIPSNILAKEASKYIPFASEINTYIEQMSGEVRLDNMVTNNLDSRLAEYSRKNKERYKILENLIMPSTFNRVDMSLSRKVYSQFGASFRDIKTGKATVKYFPTDRARLEFMKRHNNKIDPAKTSKASKLPDPTPETLLMYDTIQKFYKKLDTKGKKLYREVFDYFEEIYDRIIPAFEARVAASVADPEAKAKVMDKLRKLLIDQAGVIRPYAPLTRNGDWRLQYNTIDPDTGNLDVFVEYFESQALLEKAADLIRTRNENIIRQNPNFAERLNPATAIQFGKASARRDYNSVPPSSFIYDLLQELKRQGVEGTALDGVIDLVFDALPEKSFMQGFRSRKDVRGYLGDKTPTGALGKKFDLRELISNKGRDMSKQVTQLKYAAQIENFRRKLQVSGAKENPDTYLIAEKLDKMAEFAQSPNVPRLSQQFNTFGFAMTMGLNVSSAIITFFDVLISAMPVMSAEYGMRNTSAAYGKAMKLFGQSPSFYTIRDIGPDGEPRVREVPLGKINKSIGNLDVNAPEVDENHPLYRYKTAVNMGMERGVFNQSITGEMLEAGSSPGKVVEAINSITGGMFHHSERLNRESTYIAKYELELEKREKAGPLTEQDYVEAAEAAIDFVNIALGSTAAAGRPIWAQSGVGNVLFLFKRFAVSKYYFMYSLAKEAISAEIDADPNLTPEQKVEMKRIARKALFNFLFTTGVVTGVGGMPMMGFFGLLYDMFRDEEDEQFEEMMRSNLGEFYYGGLANEILGVDIADRISLNSLLYREPIVGKDQPALYTLFEQLGGPVVGYYLGAERALNDFDQGQYRRGMEQLLPVALRNVSKTERYAREGALTRRGDPIVDDLSPYNLGTQLIGFAPQHLGLAMDINRISRKRDQALKDKKTRLLRRLNMARREGNMQEYNEVLNDIRKYNSSLPPEARVDASKAITTKGIKQSAAAFQRRTQQTQRGITYTPMMETIAEGFDG